MIALTVAVLCVHNAGLDAVNVYAERFRLGRVQPTEVRCLKLQGLSRPFEIRFVRRDIERSAWINPQDASRWQATMSVSGNVSLTPSRD